MPTSGGSSPILSFSPKHSLGITFAAQSIDEVTVLAHTPEPEVANSDLVGLLFGTIEQGSIRIETIRQLSGKEPVALFEQLSPDQFESVLEAVRRDPSLESLQLVGWYRFHTGADLQLQPSEIEFHQRFFPARNDLAVVLACHGYADPLACVCARTHDGTFSLAQHRQVTLRLRKDQTGTISVNYGSGSLLNENVYFNRGVASEIRPLRKKKRNRFLLPSALAIGICALAGIFVFVQSDATQAVASDPVSNMSVGLNTQGSRLLVTWTGGPLFPKRAQLKVLDGDSLTQLDVLHNYRPDGSLLLTRRTGNIQAILSVNDGFRTWESRSSLIDEFAPALQMRSTIGNSDVNPELRALEEENQRLQSLESPEQRSRVQRRLHKP
jgi:hypothetical protein